MGFGQESGVLVDGGDSEGGEMKGKREKGDKVREKVLAHCSTQRCKREMGLNHGGSQRSSGWEA